MEGRGELGGWDSCIHCFSEAVTQGWSKGSPAWIWEDKIGVVDILSCFSSTIALRQLVLVSTNRI